MNQTAIDAHVPLAQKIAELSWSLTMAVAVVYLTVLIAVAYSMWRWKRLPVRKHSNQLPQPLRVVVFVIAANVLMLAGFALTDFYAPHGRARVAASQALVAGNRARHTPVIQTAWQREKQQPDINDPESGRAALQ